MNLRVNKHIDFSRKEGAIVKKSVLMVSCNGLGNGGVQNVMMNIVRNLSDEYNFDMLLFTDERRAFDDEAEKYGEIHRIPNKKTRKDYYIRFFRILIGTYKILKKRNYDVIHCNNNFESGICLFAAFLCGVKVRVVHSHMLLEIYDGNILRCVLNLFYKILLNCFATKKIACSQNAGKKMFFKKIQFKTIVNAIDLEKFNCSLRKAYEKDSLNFIHVGHFSELKNQVFIVKVFAEIKKEFPKACLNLVGQGDFRQRIIDEIRNYNLEDSVTLFPANSDIAKMMSKSDYMIFPSLKEGFGIVLLEAQATGVFCFASTNVPSEANIGMCEFLPLNIGEKAWAERIIYEINNNAKTHNCKNIKDYGITGFCEKIRDVYDE